MSLIPYIQYSERVVGENSPIYPDDVANRPLKYITLTSGLDDTQDFLGFASGSAGTGDPEGSVLGRVGDIHADRNATTGVIWVKSSGNNTNVGWKVVFWGAGTLNTIPKFGASGSLVDSIMTESGTTITVTTDLSATVRVSAVTGNFSSRVYAGLSQTNFEAAFGVGAGVVGGDIVRAYGDGVAGALAAVMVGGSLAAPSAITSGTKFGVYNFLGTDSNNHLATPIAINAYATENFVLAGAHGAKLRFAITPTGGSSAIEVIEFANNGAILAVIDNSYDIGASGATRFRTGHFGTSVVAPLFGTITNVDVNFQRNSITQLTLGTSAATFVQSVVPSVTNAVDLGSTAPLYWRNVYVATSVTFGTTAAVAGFLRYNNNPGTIIAVRDSGGGSDRVIFSVAGANNDITVGNSGLINSINLSATSGTVVINSSGTMAPSVGTQDLGTAASNWRNGLFSTTVQIGGTNVAATGALRLANTLSLIWRNQANTADINGMQIFSDNRVYIGQSSAGIVMAQSTVADADATRDLGAVATAWRVIYGPTLDTGSVSATMALRTNGTAQLTMTSLAATFAGVLTVSGATISVGTTPATSGGSVLVPNGSSSGVAARNAANSANVGMVALSSGNNLIIGSSALAGAIQFTTSTAAVWQFGNTGNFLPVLDATYNIGAAALAALTTFTRNLDTGSANDMLIKRNAVTQLTLASSLATFVGQVVLGNTTANQLQLTYDGSNLWKFNVTSVAGLELLPTGTTPNLALFAAGSYGGGKGVIFVANATTVPSSNPTGGAILYVEGGAWKARGSGGTITTFAPA